MPSRRFVLVLALLAAGCLAVAGVLHYERWSETVRSMEAETAFPGLEDRLSEIVRIRIIRSPDNPDGTLTIEQTADNWVVTEKDGYPARPSAVRELLLGLSGLLLTEARTRSPQWYGKLHLADTEEAGSRATRIVLEDANGNPLLDALFGKQVPSLSGGTPSIYVRRSGEVQSWLATGELRIRGGHLDWVPALITNIERDRLQQTVLTSPGAEPLELAWNDTLRKFRILDMPDDRTLGSRHGLLQVGIIPERLLLDDVRRAEGLTPDPLLGGAAWRTGDGLHLRLSYAPSSGDDANPWVLFSVETAADAGPAVVEEAAGIRERTEGWAFRLPATTLRHLRATMESLTRPKR